VKHLQAMKGKKDKVFKITFNAYETQRQKLTAHPTSGAITNITWRGFYWFKGKMILFLQIWFFNTVINKIPGKSFIEVFRSIDEKIWIDIWGSKGTPPVACLFCQ